MATLYELIREHQEATDSTDPVSLHREMDDD